MPADTDPRKIAEGLGEKQKAALLAMPLPLELDVAGQGMETMDSWSPATTLGVHPSTLSALNCFGGVDPKTLLAGPCLVHVEWEGRKRWYCMSPLGLAVRAILEGQNDEQ